jgi:hypothetical protein
MDAPAGYESLAAVLREALEQAAAGKGRERHAHPGEGFEDQQIMKIQDWTGGTGFAVGQVVKKAIESMRLPRDAARRELLGAIVYAAAGIVWLDQERNAVVEDDWRPPKNLPKSRARAPRKGSR